MIDIIIITTIGLAILALMDAPLSFLATWVIVTAVLNLLF